MRSLSLAIQTIQVSITDLGAEHTNVIRWTQIRTELTSTTHLSSGLVLMDTVSVCLKAGTHLFTLEGDNAGLWSTITPCGGVNSLQGTFANWVSPYTKV